MTIVNKIAASIALKNPLICVPGTMLKANFNTIPFITNENKPNVKIVIGREKNWIKGLIKENAILLLSCIILINIAVMIGSGISVEFMIKLKEKKQAKSQQEIA